ncbi:hypothetical protein BCY91_12710 [Pelobium manganitolerans]|uniref:Uncharacterized protein n=1 Tax=Pelobium manganitolerans TaxID=1842495 RepID=A0A419S1Y5_9SPHI|nr:hypothetical protein [Pelobium manganitolerans]RKD12499.1 hypothetical protein BCY91_12710 [Pelobium manganitolerans]
MEQFVLEGHIGSLVASFLLGLIAYFIKQLHKDFKKVVQDLDEMRSANAIRYAETQAAHKLLNQRLDFMEWRLDMMAPLSKSNLTTLSKKKNETDQ